MTNPNRPLVFESLGDAPGLEIVDRIEQERCVCRTDEPVTPTPADPDHFRFPVDHAVRVSASKIALPNVAGVLVRDESGEIVAQIQQLEGENLPDGTYDLELLTQFKTYLSVTSDIEISADALEFRLDFGSETDIILGARSNHERPAATVHTTDDPVDMMAAVETFSSALKTTRADRAFPSLRGHPPAVELGDSLTVPDAIVRPDTGVRMELPAQREAVYVAAPLAYYLGAGLEPGPQPRLVTDDGFEYSLAGPNGYEVAIEHTLKQLFFLDCITRTEGLYQIDLHERSEMERLIDLDFSALYDEPLHVQVAEYLNVPYEVVEEHIPDWRLTTHVQPDPSTIEQLPFVVDDLAIVRTRTTARAPTHAGSPNPTGANLDEAFTRSASSQSGSADVDYVEPQDSESLEQAWIGDDIPVGASKLTREAYENRFDLEPVDGDISITIVLNDPRMDEERDLADRAYGNRDSLPFEVDVNRDVTTDELRELLQEDAAFLHYIGHTEEDGFECPDGKLDAQSLQNVGVQSFMLNACNSYQQGLGLIEAGAVGGIVTLNDVINDGAVRIGETVARLLNSGFPLRVALSIARDESILGGQYIVVGDGGMSVAQAACTTPNLLEVSRDGDEFKVDINTFATDVAGLGSVFTPNNIESMEYYITSGKLDTFSLTRNELIDFARTEEGPIKIEGDLHWRISDDLTNII